MIFKRNNLKLGLVLGLLGPLLGLLVVYQVKYSAIRFADFFDTVIHDTKMITSIGSLSLVANVILFTIYINTQRDNTAKGIFLITVIYGITILVLKVVN
jgi:putative copper export protein